MQCCQNSESYASCIDCVPIFAGLGRKEKMEITEIASSRRFEKGETVYRAGDEGGKLFVLYTGRVKLFRLNANGKEQVLRIVGPGEFIGELSLFSSLPLSHHAQVLEPTTMCMLQGDRIKELMIKYPSIALKAMDELSRRLERAENHIEDLSLSPVATRVARALLNLSAGQDEFVLPLTKGDLASQLGMSQETLSRQLTALQEDGLILLKGHRGIIITDKSGLKKIGPAK